MKGPPDSFYEEALRVLYEIANQQLYVYVFTDSQNPPKVQQQFEKAFSGFNILFDCRSSNNAHDQNVIEDFFSLGQFECLIRPESNYSIMASHLFPFKIVISPAHCVRDENGQIIIDQLQLDFEKTESIKDSFTTLIHKWWWNPPKF